MNQKNNKNSRVITIYTQNIWVKPVTGLAYLPGNYSSMKEKEKEKSTCIDFQTDVETSLNRHIQLVESDKSLISFNYQNLQKRNAGYHQNIWVKPVTGLAYLPGNYSSMKEKEKEKSTCIDYEQKKRYSLDTCVIRNILENPNYLSCMKMHIDFEDSRVFLSETAIWEIEKQLGEINQGLTIDAVVQEIRDGLNADITILENSKETKIMADELLFVNQPDLHYPDNLHLAFSITQKTTLLSCDSKLVRCCKREGHSCINPNKLVSDSTQIVRRSSDDLIENFGLGKMSVCITRKQSCFRRRQR